MPVKEACEAVKPRGGTRLSVPESGDGVAGEVQKSLDMAFCCPDQVAFSAVWLMFPCCGKAAPNCGTRFESLDPWSPH
jgi:hypothetical protein